MIVTLIFEPDDELAKRYATSCGNSVRVKKAEDALSILDHGCGGDVSLGPNDSIHWVMINGKTYIIADALPLLRNANAWIAMHWTFIKVESPDGKEKEIHALDRALKLRAVIRKNPKAASPWTVHRLRRPLHGEPEIGGGDAFKTLKAAKEFCSNNPGVWGS